MASFDYILKELSAHIGTPLEQDETGACRIQADQELIFHLEMDQQTRLFLIFTELNQVPPGKFRDDVCKSALIENGKPEPRNGDLAFSTVSDKLVLFKFIAIENINFEWFLNFFTLFCEKAFEWKEGVERGALPTLPEVVGGDAAEMFGLKKK